MVLRQVVPPPKQPQINLPLLFVSLALAMVFCILSVGAWRWRGSRLAPFEAALFTLSGVGLALYAVLPRRKQPLVRKLILLLGGGAGLLFALSSRVSLDLVEFFLVVLCGTMGAAIGHHLITVIVGPIFWGRLWCGWGCWTAMILDLLPFGRSPGRLQGKWKSLPLVTFAMTFGVAAIACLAFGYRGMAMAHNSPHPSELYWILTINILYYLTGIYLGFVLKENRAFCKYVCPTTVLLKATSRFSTVKIAGRKDQCNDCGACAEACPMDILIPEYVKQGQRVLSTECILCRTCVSVCPRNVLGSSFGFDLGSHGQLAGRKPEATWASSG